MGELTWFHCHRPNILPMATNYLLAADPCANCVNILGVTG